MKPASKPPILPRATTHSDSNGPLRAAKPLTPAVQDTKRIQEHQIMPQHTPNLVELSSAEAKLKIRQFIEDEPLFSPIKIQIKDPIKSNIKGIHQLMPETIHLYCASGNCSHLASTTWEAVNASGSLHAYICASCKESKAQYWFDVKLIEKQTTGLVNMSPVEVIKSFEISKLGQRPHWAPKIPNRLLKNLGPSAQLFRRGVACLQEGLGIGASAYFRRVIEEEVKALLDLMEKAANLDGDQAALENLKTARESQVASERLKIAVQKVPISLRPGNANPLAVLYGALSGAVHQEPEEVAIGTAKRILKTFIFLFEELKERMDSAEAYAAEIQQIRDETKKSSNH
ncbi:hypothetical protein [Myxococcus virescens]|uniref:hypothetical protein n=1 Tax=Myxococcus virescens TaxID=83456 RepID=UPI00115FEFFC|nr:hypothetical protein [Myxococcus virescens]